MRLLCRAVVVLAWAMLLNGCAGPSRALPGASGDERVVSPAPTSRSVDPKADWTVAQVSAQILEQATEQPNDATLPSTQPTTQPALAAIELYARARGALAERQVYTAVNLLERCATLDPQSSEVQFALARAYQAMTNSDDKALAAYRRAARLDPTSLDTWLELGRLLARQSPEAALHPLLRAAQTTRYARDDGRAAQVDLLLAQALQQGGYESAAIEQYEQLLKRIGRRTLSIRSTPEAAALAARPAAVQFPLARLYERRGEADKAIALYEQIAQSAPDAFEPQARVVRAMLAVGRNDAATRRAGDIVRLFEASTPSIDLFVEAHRQSAGNDEQGDSRAVSELSRLYRSDPENEALLTALASLLGRVGRSTDALRLMDEALARRPQDLSLLRRVVRLHYQAGDGIGGARVLVEQSAKHPQLAAELAPLWRPLVEPWREGAIRPDDLRRLELPPTLDAARFYWVARLASEARRPVLAEESLALAAARGASGGSAFTPALLLRIQQTWQSPRLEPLEKSEQADALLAAVTALGDAKLTALMTASDAYYRHGTPADLPAFEAAMSAVGDDAPPQFVLLHAESLRRAGQGSRFEQVLWKLLSERPRFEDAYMALYAHYVGQSAAGSAVKVLDTWARADAETLTGRVIYADLMLDARQFPLAEAALDGLLTDYPDEADVLGLYLRLAGATGRQQQAIDRLEQLRLRDPTNGAVIQALVAAHRQRGETPAALRVLERSAEAASRQPNLLYQIASLYFLMEQKDLSQTLLERVLSVDSTHVAASNDLAYYWSDAGANLERSEALARQAVASEPDNSAYLDTLGWVLYKRGRFEEARKYLLQAVDVAPEPDPEVLDHLADASYRMGDYAEAASRWQQAAAILRNPGVITDRPDRAELRLRVDGKIRQRLAGEEVDVARLGSAEDS